MLEEYTAIQELFQKHGEPDVRGRDCLKWTLDEDLQLISEILYSANFISPEAFTVKYRKKLPAQYYYKPYKKFKHEPHRTDGPAYIKYDLNSEIRYVSFYADGICKSLGDMIKEFPEHRKELLLWM